MKKNSRTQSGASHKQDRILWNRTFNGEGNAKPHKWRHSRSAPDDRTNGHYGKWTQTKHTPQKKQKKIEAGTRTTGRRLAPSREAVTHSHGNGTHQKSGEPEHTPVGPPTAISNRHRGLFTSNVDPRRAKIADGTLHFQKKKPTVIK